MVKASFKSRVSTVKEQFYRKVRSTPEWIKVTIPFVIGIIASPAVQNLFNEVYQMNTTLSGNMTYIAVADYLNMSGGDLLYSLVLVLMLLTLFALLAWAWSKDGNKTHDDIQEIKRDVKTLLGKDS